MSQAASDVSAAELPSLPREGASPRAVREALRPEFREEFDRAFRDALDVAAREMDLTSVQETVEHWRRRAWVTRDPEQHRRVVRRAVLALTGELPPEDEPTVLSEDRL
jgi:hypothetical protein